MTNTYVSEMQMSLQRRIDMAKKPDSPTVPTGLQPTACATGTKPEKRGKSLLSKSPSGTGDLDDTVQKRRKKEATEELPKPLCCHSTLPTAAPSVTSFLFFLFHKPSPHFLPPRPAIPLIATF